MRNNQIHENMQKSKNTTIPNKRNPLLDNIKTETEEQKAEKSRAVRIRESSFQYLRRYAFENETTMIDAVEEAIELLKRRES
ncbi:hypothetical protein [Savagea faecisuis]|uniref:Uncharacterized protein n=1 Tax=Savagea faecisuis TaxID=1274803 RepID=A0ABW3GYD9_9BACL